MPRASINIEFEDGELRKFIEDGLRRWTLNTIHDVIKHIRDPNVASLIMQLFQTGIAAGASAGAKGRGSEQGPTYHQRPDGDGVQGRSPFPGPGMVEEILRGSPGAPGPKRCMPVEANLYQEEGWGCHKCSTYNGAHRPVCRQCGHERCDVRVSTSDEDPVVPSGSA